MRYVILITMLFLLSTKHTHGTLTEWGCKGEQNTGTFQRSTDCTISGTTTTTTNGAGGVVVTNTLEIVGMVEDMNNLITITTVSKQRHFYINGANDKLILRYLKLTGGQKGADRYACVSGGSIFITDGKLNIFSSIIVNNCGGYGGAICADGNNGGSYQNNLNPTININNCVVGFNEAMGGGGISITYATGSIVNSVIHSNFNNAADGSGEGGGINIMQNSKVTIMQSNISHNRGVNCGGGIAVSGHTNVNITQTIIEKNTNSRGGGLCFHSDSDVIIRETSFISNSATSGWGPGPKYLPMQQGSHICIKCMFAQTRQTSIINTFFSNSNTSGDFYPWQRYSKCEVIPKNCSSNVCTEAPYTSACSPVDSTNFNFGVYCHQNEHDTIQCNPSKIRKSIGVNTNKCTPCGIGAYQDDPGQTACKKCGIGRYNDVTTGLVQCKSCGINMYTTEEGESSQSSCKVCTPTTNSPVCSVCTKGQFGLKTCQNCMAGMYADKDHMVKCKPCEAGQYVTHVGATACIKCKKGEASVNPGESAETACIKCLPGSYSTSDGAATCTKCSLGKASTQVGAKVADVCKDCIAGKYSIVSACADCSPGYYSSAHAAASNATCEACPAERFYTPSGATLISQCSCPGGNYLEDGKCTSCLVNNYCPGNNTIKPCPFGYNTDGSLGAVNESQCLLCTKNCIACPKNTYSVIGAGCQFCPKNTPATLGIRGATKLSQCKLCNPGSGFPNYGFSTGKCTICSSNYKGIGYGPCIPCAQNEMSSPGSSECFSPQEFKKQLMDNINEISATQGGLIKAIALSNAKSNEVKQKANGLIAKLSLNWATQDVINEAQKLRSRLSKLPEYNVSHHCEQEKERLAYGVLRTGVIVPSDAEIDDKYCLNENRNRLITAFCNFRPRFIKLLQDKAYANPSLPNYPKYTGRDLWPNICCRKDNFEDLKSCNDPSGNVPRSEIVPFALAQGGNITVENLYGEIVDIIKKDGYLQEGMNKPIQGIFNGDKVQTKLNTLLETTLLCGPREFGLPTNEGIRLCELFYPYEHMLSTYYDEVDVLLDDEERRRRRRRRRRLLGMWPSIQKGFTNIINSASVFMFGKDEEDGKNRDDGIDLGGGDDNVSSNSEIRKLEKKVEMLAGKTQRLEKKDAILTNEAKQSRNEIKQSHNKIKRLEKKDAILEKEDAILQKKTDEIDTLKHATNKTNHFLAILKQNNKLKQRRLGGGSPSLTDELCPVVTMKDVSQYQKDKELFCTGYAHIDLNHPGTVINVAIMTPWDIPKDKLFLLGARKQGRYEISDDCPTPMFTANDISLQNIDGMDLFIVKLDSTSPNGYLKRELPQCGTRNNMALKPHIPKTTIDVKIWLDHNGCCADTKDYQVCKAIKCLATDDPNGIQPVNDPWTNQQIGYNYKVIGTTFTATCDNKPNNQPCGSSNSRRRRRLLQLEYGNSGERL